MSKWSPEEDDELSRMWAARDASGNPQWSAWDIANTWFDKFCRPITRNAVIGRVHRLMLPARGKRVPHPRPKRPKRPNGIDGGMGRKIAVKEMRNFGGHFVEVTVGYDQLPIATADIDIPMSQRKTLHQLTNETCRYPVGHPGEPGFFFCGGQIIEQRPYCDYHCRVCYTQDHRPRHQNNWVEFRKPNGKAA